MNKEEREESWRFLDLMADYKRMGVPNNLWVATAANSEYRVSLNASREVLCNNCKKLNLFFFTCRNQIQLDLSRSINHDCKVDSSTQ